MSEREVRYSVWYRMVCGICRVSYGMEWGVWYDVGLVRVYGMGCGVKKKKNGAPTHLLDGYISANQRFLLHSWVRSQSIIEFTERRSSVRKIARPWSYPQTNVSGVRYDVCVLMVYGIVCGMMWGMV